MTSTLDTFAALQGLLGARAYGRMLATSAGDPIGLVTGEGPDCAGATVVLPVLDESERIGPALESLCAQSPMLRTVLVVDGGSRDDTRRIVRDVARRDSRVTLIDAGAPPAGWNGKAWNLSCGLAASDPACGWIVMMDADVRLHPAAIASLLAFARYAYVDAFSAAPLLELSGAAEAAFHPALLATLVYRFGLPGNVARDEHDVQANGQLFVARRELLVRTRAIGDARASRFEDVTIARALVRAGARVGFFEASALARVRMYESARACVENWPRSLGLRDTATEPIALAATLVELALVQALPVWCALAALVAGDAKSPFFRINAMLALARFGVLAGTSRAYDRIPPTFWLAPFFDAFALASIARASLRKRPRWRGRELVA